MSLRIGLHTYSSASQFFHPAFNGMYNYTRGGNQLTVAGYKDFLTKLYTPENLRDHPEIIATWHDPADSNTALLTEKILAAVPEHKLWALSFLSLDLDGEQVRYSFIKYGSRYTEYAEAAYRYYDDYGTLRSRVTGPNIGANVLEKIDLIVDAFDTATAGHATMLFGSEYNFTSFNPFTKFAVQALGGKGCVYDTNARGSWMTLKQVHDAYLADPNGFSLREVSNGQNITRIEITISISAQNRTPLHKLLNYTTNVCELLGGPLLDKNEKEEHTTLYGVELEVSTDYTVRELVEAGRDPFLACKSDGSVSGNKRYPVEMVTRPMSMKMQRKQWAYFFHKLDYEKFDTSKNTTNGMHVHIDRRAFYDELHLKKFAWFFTQPANKDFMLAMSERSIESFDQYSGVPHFRNRTTKGSAFASVIQEVMSLRGAVNLKKGPTVEVRLFRGVVSYASILKNLEFVEAALMFSEGQSISQLSVKHFFAWLEQQPRNKYSVLRRYFEEMDIQSFLMKSEMKSIIFTERDVQKIIKLLTDAKVQITQEHVKILNEEQFNNGGGKDVFIFKNGTIELHPKLQNNLKTMDRILEKNILRGWL